MASSEQFYKNALRCLCPKCGDAPVFKKGALNFNLQEACIKCGFALSDNDSADGPAVFLVFVLGFLIVPLALLLDAILSPPLYVHIVLWSVITVALILLSLKPLKSIVIALQYKYRPDDWDNEEHQ